MIDLDEETRRVKQLAVASLIFLISAIFSYGELKFLIWGRTAEANVTRSSLSRETLHTSEKRIVEFTFTDEKLGPLSEKDSLPTSFDVQPGPAKVQYLPGVPDSSRIEGNSRMVSVLAFFGALLWMGRQLFALWREAQEPVRGRRRR